jgi:aminoglycoside phosphotransferase (APT) family kinase protein
VTGPVLSPAEAQVVSVLLADAWGPGSEIRGAEMVWDRRHVVRVHVATGRSVIVKRRRKQDAEGFGVELAALEYLVHGDACPDNVRFLADGGRIFDFETSGWGPVVLDAAYLLAPFPSCWCFATLPAEVAAPAMDAYRAVVQGPTGPWPRGRGSSWARTGTRP